MSHSPAHSTVFHAIADPTRRAILDLLRDGPRSASALTAPFQASQSAISQHLAILRRANLVTQRREGRYQLYSLRPEPLQEVADWIASFDRLWEQTLREPGSIRERTE
jgi:DNA-binding transcriptional ArsR family regulator